MVTGVTGVTGTTLATMSAVLGLLFATGCREEGPSPLAAAEIVADEAPLGVVGELAEAKGSVPSDGGARQVFFGDLHVHSSWSFDAFSAGVDVGPAYAYRYARGESIPHPSGGEIQLLGPPLDFIAVTEHAEYLGLTNAAANPNHPLRAQPLIQAWKGNDPRARRRAWNRIDQSYSDRIALPALVADSVMMPTWRGLIRLANREYRPGSFTTFLGFEYSPNPDGQNLHRNVLFRGDRAPDRPFSSMDSANPEDLWDWMDDARKDFGDVLAIPHNANGSNGLMFAETRHDGTPIDAAWAEQRARNEPVAEAFQIKGQSETHPMLSPDDEWAGFEIFDRRTTRPGLSSQPEGSYIRDALKRGLSIEDRVGHNPYALGMIGSTDGHNASSPFEERNYTGKIGRSDATPEGRLAWIVPANPNLEPFIAAATRWGAAGLAGVWAEENSRESLFDAIRRRETFATSGPRIRVRMFAGWDFEPAEADGEIAQPGFSRGVVMGRVLRRSARPAGSAAESPEAPTFLVAAQRDPLEAELERVQIVKGWHMDGEMHERVFDIACAQDAAPNPKTHRCPERAAEPNLETCKPAEGAGVSEFSVWWRDPEFDPDAAAFYYARVLQIPTCRWSTYDANRLGQPLHTGVPATLQERAVTSPVWLRGVEAERAGPRATRGPTLRSTELPQTN